MYSEEFEDTKGGNQNPSMKKDRWHNGQRKSTKGQTRSTKHYTES